MCSIQNVSLKKKKEKEKLSYFGVLTQNFLTTCLNLTHLKETYVFLNRGVNIQLELNVLSLHLNQIVHIIRSVTGETN